jgi:hypothetical protein
MKLNLTAVAAISSCGGKYPVPILKKSMAQMRAKKAGTTGY